MAHMISFLGIHFISAFIDLMIYIPSFHSISIIVLSLILIVRMGLLLVLRGCNILFALHNFKMALFPFCRLFVATVPFYTQVFTVHNVS